VFICRVDVSTATNRVIACWTCKYKGLLHCKQMRDAHHAQNVSRFCISFVNVATSLWLASELLSVIFLNYLLRGSRPQSHFENRNSLREMRLFTSILLQRVFKIAGEFPLFANSDPFKLVYFGLQEMLHKTFFRLMQTVQYKVQF